ncbi:branched-chain amino acid ABC transporter permease [Marivibrio halodurans]|uniref:Branched-chain amino acid ABC transporter permease n=1 Tax=Marivibrio halodurans TaxID=2039722 RepID=A0A8J7S2D0_9PROT|nr:branched-chain amino acid ABC transporter permease [Marivibrio halodurans]MBP5858565.1 branched-chain amino acid ABC transporter permease [Marivibrio halodurans]
MIAYLVTIATLVSIAVLIAMALNVQWGMCGMVNFGLAGFVALGAYTTAILTLAGWPALFAVAASVVVCAVMGGLLSLISMRLSEDYLAIVTLGFGEIVRLVTLNEGWLTGGALGLPGIPRPLVETIGSENYETAFLAGAVLIVAIVYFGLERLTRSPVGAALRAVRDDDLVASSLGRNVLLLRVKAFALGGGITAIAGSLQAFQFSYIDPSQFTAIMTAYAFMAVIAGGRGSHRGLILGACSIMFLLEASRFLKDVIEVLDNAQIAAIRLILIGAGLILLLIFRPQGLMREYRLSAPRATAATAPPPTGKE